MLLDSNYTIVPQIRFTLTYDSGVRKVVTVKSKDVINCSYKQNGEKFCITGVVTKICCNFNSSLGSVGTTAYLQIDGSSEYSGEVVYIQPSQVLDLTIISTSDVTENIVCSVDNEDQRISLIRENEVGVFQYSLDGVTWKAAVGAQGMSAYECACALGYVGTEEEWLASLKGEKGDTGEAGALEIYKIFHSKEAAEEAKCCIPAGKLIGVVIDDNTLLYVRLKGCSCDEVSSDGSSSCCTNNVLSDNSGCTSYVLLDDVDEDTYICGYDFVGYLSIGPQGPQGEKGDDGKSAYEYAVEGGYTGTEEDFTQALARTGVAAVTSFYMGNDAKLQNTVIGPIDLRVFGYTDTTTLVSKSISRIDIYSKDETVNQTLLFPEPVILRAVPTERDSAKPNVVIGGVKYVADVIMNYEGKVGVLRRVKYLESYNGETILGDWISSTGELDLGAKVQYTIEGTFEPFEDLVQSQYKKFHTYDEYSYITTTENTYISVSYPIDIKSYMDTYIKEHSTEIVEKANEYTDSKIGILPEGKTVQDVISEVEEKTIIGETITTTIDLGGIPAGTEIKSTEALYNIIKTLLCPGDPVMDSTVYTGVSDTIPSDISELTGVEVNKLITINNGFTTTFDSDDQYLLYAYDKEFGELVSIVDKNGLELISGWSKVEYTDGDKTYYIYHSNETLTVNSFEITFIYK